MNSFDESMMRRALDLAHRGAGRVSPNPLVGCVIVGKDGTVLGEGAHLVFGGAHAEPNAIQDAESREHTVRGATAYVTLEPHAHHGKTPPCTTLLIEKGIAKVVIAMEDPNPAVSGKGIRELKDAGIEVRIGILETEARELNRFFLRHVTTGLPYVTLKIASSLDGKSALASGESKWITSEASRRMVHQMRTEYDAVLIGTRTALIDNPSLTPRLVEGRTPLRIVLDSKLILPLSLNVFTDPDRERTIVVTTPESYQKNGKTFEERGVKTLSIEGSEEKIDLQSMFRVLGKQHITSVLIEAGPKLAASVIRERLFQEILLFFAPKILGSDGIASVGALRVGSLSAAPELQFQSVERVKGSDDVLLRFFTKVPTN